ncbi:phage head-tail joining protein [Oceanicaulis alexandrii]
MRDSNGEEIEYRSVRELTAAIAALEREIEKVSGRAAPKTIVFKTSKGL